MANLRAIPGTINIATLIKNQLKNPQQHGVFKHNQNLVIDESGYKNYSEKDRYTECCFGKAWKYHLGHLYRVQVPSRVNSEAKRRRPTLFYETSG